MDEKFPAGKRKVYVNKPYARIPMTEHNHEWEDSGPLAIRCRKCGAYRHGLYAVAFKRRKDGPR